MTIRLFIVLAAGLAALWLARDTRAEMRPDRSDFHHAVFLQADMNKDGTVTKDDLTTLAAQEFQAYDPNRDGKTTFAEVLSIGGMRVFTRVYDLTQQGLLASLRATFNYYDTDKDGRVLVDEFVQLRRASFLYYYDANNDGQVPFAEFAAPRAPIAD